MKVCYVGNFNTLSVGEPEVAKCLEELDATVIRLQERETNLDEIRRNMESCDFLLFSKLRINNTPKEIKEFMDTYPKPKICWLFDLYFGLYDNSIRGKLFTL